MALAGAKVDELLSNVVAAGPAAAAAGPGAAAAEEEEKKEEKKEEVEDVDMGGLFGGDDDDYWTKRSWYRSNNMNLRNGSKYLVFRYHKFRLSARFKAYLVIHVTIEAIELLNFS